jgi:hydroxylamine reductase
MLPTHGYPKLKAYPHFYGHFGTAWQNQQKEFAQFPGAILMTTNCIQRPVESYKGNLFASGPVGYPGIPHISGKDFTPVINNALVPGFTDDVEGSHTGYLAEMRYLA